MSYVCDVLNAVLYVRVNCFAVHGCDVLRRNINVCNSDVISVVNNMYIDHLKFCAVVLMVDGMLIMVEGMFVVVNVMLFLMCLMSPPLPCGTYRCAQ